MNKLLGFLSFFNLLLVSALLFAQEAEEPTPFSLPRTDTVEILDPIAERSYKLYIQTPIDYFEEANIKKQYPVIYISDATYIFPVLEGFMRVASNGTAVKKSILVGISSELGKPFQDSRALDYTPIKDVEWLRDTGGSDDFLKFIREVVISYIEANYRANSGTRVYIGSSLGGLLGAYTLVSEPAMFNGYILASPSLWFDDQYIFRFLESDAISQPTMPTKVFLSAGEFENPEDQPIRNDLVSDASDFAKKLQEWDNSNLEVQMQVVKGAVHSTAFPEPMARAIYWMLKGEGMP